MAQLDLIIVDDNVMQQKVTKFIEENLNETLYPGDERKIFTEALLAWVVQFCVELNEEFNQRFSQYASGKILDAHGENEGCPRLPKTKSISTERFILSAAIAHNIVIPAGTRVTADNEKYFATDNLAVIYSGQTQIDVPISAVEGGASYNGYTEGQINKLVDKIEYISAVTNLDETSGGDDGEPYPEEDNGAGDEHYYERIRLVKATKSTAGAEETYKYYAKSADPRISDVGVDSPEEGVIELSIALADGELADQNLLDKVVETCSAKEVRPLGDKVRAKAITQIPYDIEFKYYTTQAEEAATIEEVEGTGGAIERYNEWQTDAIAKEINPDRLRSEVLKNINKPVGADRIEIVSPVYTQLSTNQIAKFSGNITVTHELTDGD